MARTIYNNPNLPRSKSPHSNAVKIGNLIFVSGFPGYDENVQVPRGDFAKQMRLALQHIKATLEYAGSSIDKIGKVNIYLDRRADFDEMNEIYKEFFGSEPSGWPARTNRGGPFATQGFPSRNRLRRRSLTVASGRLNPIPCDFDGAIMLTDQQRRQGAADLYRAEQEKKVIPQLSRTFPDIELEDAYAIQRMWAEIHVGKGARRIGHKIGLTSRAMQMASKITEPDYGHLLDSMMYRDGAQIPAKKFLKPRLEVELAFIMGADLEGPGTQIYDVMRATEFVQPALEIIDYRTEVPRAITDTIADNAAAGGIIVGGRTIKPFDVDTRWVGATLSKNGTIEESGVSAAIMGHPAAGVAWLVDKLSAVGAKLEKGQIVLAGSFTRPVDIAAGDVIQADYGPLGAIGVSFV